MQYEEPKIHVVCLASYDIIRTSDEDNDLDYGEITDGSFAPKP